MMAQFAKAHRRELNQQGALHGGGGGDYNRSGCDTPPPAICQNLGGGGGGSWGVPKVGGPTRDPLLPHA